MTPQTIPVTAPEPAGMNVFARLAGVVFEPSKTFEDIARRPTFMVPLALVLVFGLVFIAAFSQRVGWEKTVRDKIEASSQSQQLSAEQKAQQIALWTKITPFIGYGGVVFGTVVTYLLVALVLWGIAAGMMSAPIKFTQVFAVACWSHVVTCISMALATVVIFLKNPDDFDINNPLMFNLGALFEPNMPSKFIHSLASSIDLFPFWVIFLLATGLKAAGGRRFSFGSALTAVLLPWAAYVLLKSGATALFS